MRTFKYILFSMLLTCNAMADDMPGAISACNSNWDLLVSSLVTAGTEMGNPPSDEELVELEDMRGCECTYNKVNERITDLDNAKVEDDMLLFERWYSSIIRRGVDFSPPAHERIALIASLTYGEPILLVRVNAQMECMQK